jgi:hypothetical protein
MTQENARSLDHLNNAMRDLGPAHYSIHAAISEQHNKGKHAAALALTLVKVSNITSTIHRRITLLKKEPDPTRTHPIFGGKP